MLSLAVVYKGIKSAAALFGKLSDADRAAARKQAHLLDHLAEDLLAIRESLNAQGRIDSFAYSKFKLAAKAGQDAVPDLQSEIKNAEAMVDSVYKSASGGPPGGGNISNQIGEFAGAFKGSARTLLTLSEPNK